MLIEPRMPVAGQGDRGLHLGANAPVTATATETSWTTAKTTFETITKSPCACTTPTPPPIVITTTSTTRSAVPVVTQYVHHENDGLAPGVIGGIVIGAFFGFLLLVLLLICCCRIFIGSRRDDDSEISSHSRRRRRRRIIPIDPYPNRPDANLTFLGGGNRRDTKVVITRTQRYFVRPQPAVIRDRYRESDREGPPTRTVRTKQTRRERVVIVGD